MNDFSNSLNKAFYFVTDKLIELQSFFIGTARGIAYVVLLIAICSAAVNYALTGTGLKENAIKILKAVVFYAVVLFAYPNIVSWITSYTFQLARDSTYAPMSGIIKQTQTDITDDALAQKGTNKKGTYGETAVTSNADFFAGILNRRTFIKGDGDTISYTTVAPAAALRAIMLVAGECLKFSDENSGLHKLGEGLKGLFCAFFIILVGVFAILEYLVAFIEFLFVSSVGIILFPFSLWDGSKFIAEKFVGAILGFFIKLLLCTICIFLMLYGYLTLAHQFSSAPFTGAIEQIVIIFFSSLLFFYICKSAPALAQSLLTGTPSLNAAGAIGAAVSATGAVVGAAHLVGRTVMDTGGALARAGGAATAAGGANGGLSLSGVVAGAGAFTKSLGTSALDTVKDKGGELTRSLLGQDSSSGRHSGGPEGHNVHESASQRYMRANEDGTKRSMGQVFHDKVAEGKKSVPQAPGRSPGSPIGKTYQVGTPSEAEAKGLPSAGTKTQAGTSGTPAGTSQT